MKRVNYWLFLIEWDFWAWKSLHLSSLLFEEKRRWAFIVFNNPYDFVDTFYDTKEDFKKMLDILYVYMEKSNANLKSSYPRLIIGIDETHLYWFSRNFKDNFSENQLKVLTQLRKRNILMPLVSQRYMFLDKNLRRLVWFVRQIHSWSIPFTTKKLFGWFQDLEILNPEGDDIYSDEWENKVYRKIYSFPLIQNFFVYSPLFLYQSIWKQKELTNNIIGFQKREQNLERLEKWLQENWL